MITALEISASRRGAALLMVLLALTLLGGVIATVFMPALEAGRAGINSLRLAQAITTAEGAVDETLAGWSENRYDTLGVGDSVNVSGASLSSRSGWYRGTIHPVGGGNYLLRAEGFSRDSMARREMSVVLETRPYQIHLDVPIRTRDSVILGAAFHLVFNDSFPPEAGDCVDSLISGGPLSHDSVDDGAMTLGVMQDLFARAASLGRSRILPAGTYLPRPSESGGRCLRSDVSNWGDVRAGSACHSYFPIMEVVGDLNLSGGSGQGVLIVHGKLSLGGGTKFFGIVLVDGPLTIAESEIFGGVLTSAKAAETTLQDGSILYSGCALANASRALGTVDFLDRRAWYTSH